jgi:hypothetical protein
MPDAHSQVKGYTMQNNSDSPTNCRRLQVTVCAFAVLAVAVWFLAAPVMAHAPTDMTISFDPSTAKISVTITHPVDDPATHYVSVVRVKQNERVISDPPYKSQPTKDTFTYTYDVNANPGDEIRVTAICIKGGTLEKVYTVPRPSGPTTPVPSRNPSPALPTAKAPAGLLPLFGAAALMIIRRY